MDILQALSLTIVLILALFGCAYLLERASARLLRPKKEQVVLVLPLKADSENAEQQIRSAQHLSRRLSLPLVCVDCGMDEETRHIAQVLIDSGAGMLLEEETLQKIG